MSSILRGALIAASLATAPVAPAIAQGPAARAVDQVRLDVGEKTELYLSDSSRRLGIEHRSSMTLTGEYRSSTCDVVLSTQTADGETNTRVEISIPFLGQWRDETQSIPVTATCGEEDDNIILLVDARGSGAVADEGKTADLGTANASINAGN